MPDLGNIGKHLKKVRRTEPFIDQYKKEEKSIFHWGEKTGKFWKKP